MASKWTNETEGEYEWADFPCVFSALSIRFRPNCSQLIVFYAFALVFSAFSLCVLCVFRASSARFFFVFHVFSAHLSCVFSFFRAFVRLLAVFFLRCACFLCALCLFLMHCFVCSVCFVCVSCVFRLYVFVRVCVCVCVCACSRRSSKPTDTVKYFEPFVLHRFSSVKSKQISILLKLLPVSQLASTSVEKVSLVVW